jgi:nicotinate-nucleotide adenylyltransferase
MHIGLYFGSFNPIHIGHLVIAGTMAEFSDLDKVWLVVSPHNPHKAKSSLLRDYDRLHLVRLALEDYPYLQASDVEFQLPQPSYTAHTLVHLSEKYPQHTFSLIMGADTLESFPKWRNPDSILAQHRIYVYPRPGHDGGPLRDHPQVHWVEAMPLMELSSTRIREGIAAGKTMKYMLPKAVWEYIDEMHYYRH